MTTPPVIADYRSGRITVCYFKKTGKKGRIIVKFNELLDNIDSIVEKERYEKKKREIFNMREETPDELYVKSCDDDDE